MKWGLYGENVILQKMRLSANFVPIRLHHQTEIANFAWI